MYQTKSRWLVRSPPDSLSLCKEGLKINGTLAIKQVGPFYLPVISRSTADDVVVSALVEIATAMNNGRMYEALLCA